jgi:hypothetical protein
MIVRKTMIIAVFASVLILTAHVVLAKVVECTSLQQSVVQAAVNTCVDGDTVLLPEGNATWTTLSSGAPSVSVIGKAITIIGAGIDKTVITGATGTAWLDVPILIDNAKNGLARLSGMTFKGTSPDFGVIYIDRTPTFRIDNCKFQDIGKRGITARSSLGVIDHCSFLGAINGGINVIGASDGGDAKWKEPLSLGSSNAVYVEDCIFDFGHSANDGAIDCYAGGSYVFRHNTVVNMEMGSHGLDSVANTRSTFSVEIYDNTYTADMSVFRAIYLRGGTGVVFNNTFSSNYQIALQVANYRTCLPYSWGLCDGANPLDGNQPGMQGYPCRDQIGRATNQTLQPFYEWNNTKNGTNVNVSVYIHSGCSNPSPLDHIKENRDYYNDTPRPGYTPYTYPHPLAAVSSAQPSPPVHLRIK